MAGDLPARLAALLRAQMDELEAIIAPLSDDQASWRYDGGWSVKETLSHLQGGEGETTLDAIHRIIREDEPAIELMPGITNYNADRRDAPSGMLLSAVLAQYRGIAEVIRRADDETLARRVLLEPSQGTSMGARLTLMQWIEDIIERHVAGHLADLRARAGLLT